MGYGTIEALRRLSSFLFFGLILWGIYLGKSHPTEVLIGSVLLLGFGLPLSLYSIYRVQKYKDVFDFEPTTFMGKERNGKYVRQVLMAWISIGGWCAITGAVLILMRS